MKKLLAMTVINCVIFSGLTAGALETSKALKKDYDQFKKDMTVKMETLEMNIDELRKRTEIKADEAQTKVIADLEESKNSLRAEMTKLETEIPTKTKSNWRKLKTKMAVSIDKLNKKAQELLKKE